MEGFDTVIASYEKKDMAIYIATSFIIAFAFFFMGDSIQDKWFHTIPQPFETPVLYS